MTCLHCGADMAGKQTGAQFCSRKCKSAAYYAANIDAMRERNRRNRAANPPDHAQVAEYQRGYRAANADAIAARVRKWQAANPERMREYNRKYLEKKKNNPKVTP